MTMRSLLYTYYIGITTRYTDRIRTMQNTNPDCDASNFSLYKQTTILAG